MKVGGRGDTASLERWGRHAGLDRRRQVGPVALNIRFLKAAADWAYDERRLAVHPLAGMNGPGPGELRRDVPLPVVRYLLCQAEQDVHTAQVSGGASRNARGDELL